MTSKISAILACTILTTAAGYFTGCCSDAGHPDMDKLNARAAQEYLDPIRPGYEGRNPYWNGFATKFIYAPAFDFKTIDGAAGYRYTAQLNFIGDAFVLQFVVDNSETWEDGELADGDDSNDDIIFE